MDISTKDQEYESLEYESCDSRFDKTKLNDQSKTQDTSTRIFNCQESTMTHSLNRDLKPKRSKIRVLKHQESSIQDKVKQPWQKKGSYPY